MEDLAEIQHKPKFLARAILVGERIDLRTLAPDQRLAASPVTVTVRGGGVAVLFRYGAVVLFDVTELEQDEFLRQLRPRLTQPCDRPETEEVAVQIATDAREGIEGNVLSLADRSLERLQIVADVLSKSIVLAKYEASIAENFERIEPVAVNLQQRGDSGRNRRELLQHIGGALLSEHNMVGRVELGDKPELVWDRPDLERLYLRLADEFELRERHAALERKLEVISRTAETVLEVLHNRHSLRVEWYIVILIVVEILLTLYGMFVHGK